MIWHDTTLEFEHGDIAAQSDMAAVVNAANAQLMPGEGVAGALHRAAGPGLAEECRPLAPIAPGQAVMTGGHQLPNRYVIHCLGPVWGVDQPAEERLRACYRNALRLAEEHAVDSVAFPAISTGAFAYPFELAMRTAIDAVLGTVREQKHPAHIRFVFMRASEAEQAAAICAERIAAVSR